MNFAETRLELGIDYGTVGGPRFSTSIIVDGSGAEQRNANWTQSLGRWQLGERSLSQDELDYFLDFHAARKGAAEGFRFRDWADYQGKSQPLGTGDGTKTQFQLVKKYTIGAYSAIRPVLKPIGGTVKVYSNGIPQDTVSVDVATGIVTFQAAPSLGAALTADFEFDVPVRFEQDKVDFRFDAYEAAGRAIFNLAPLSVVEIRIPPVIAVPPSAVHSRIDETLDLGYDYGTVGGPAYNTNITTVGAGYERRENNWNASRGRWQIGDRTLTRAELDYLIAFFRVTNGSATEFDYQDWQRDRSVPVRFEQDSIEFRFDALEPETGEAIFYLAGLPLTEIAEGAVADYQRYRYEYENGIFIFIPDPAGYETLAAAEAAASAAFDQRYRCENGNCVADPSGPYTNLAECKAALIPASFTGGQCPILYLFKTAHHWTYNGIPFSDTGVYGPVYGPIGDWRVRYPAQDAAVFEVLCHGTPNGAFGYPPGRWAVQDWQAYSGTGGAIPHDFAITVNSVYPQDSNQPDDCGDPPPRCRQI